MIDWNLPHFEIAKLTRNRREANGIEWDLCTHSIHLLFNSKWKHFCENWMLLFICSVHIFSVKIIPNPSISYEPCGNGKVIAFLLQKYKSNDHQTKIKKKKTQMMKMWAIKPTKTNRQTKNNTAEKYTFVGCAKLCFSRIHTYKPQLCSFHCVCWIFDTCIIRLHSQMLPFSVQNYQEKSLSAHSYLPASNSSFFLSLSFSFSIDKPPIFFDLYTPFDYSFCAHVLLHLACTVICWIRKIIFKLKRSDRLECIDKHQHERT